MSTIALHPEYASRRSGPSQVQSSDRNSFASTNITEKRAADETKLSFLLDNPFYSFSKKGKEEGSLFVGIFNDIFKNIPRLLTGSLLTDVVKSLYKNADLTWQKAVYKNLLDGGPSRLFNDVLNSIVVRFLNGNHSFLKLFKLPYIAPEIASQLTSPIMVTLMRSLTAKSNVNAESARNNISEEQAKILQEINRSDKWFFNMVDSLSDGTMDKIKPYINKLFSWIGIKAGEVQRDKEGKIVYQRDEKTGKLKKDENKNPIPLETNPEINKTLLSGVVAGSYLGSFLLPRHTSAFGFEEAKTIPRLLISTLTTTLCRINTTILHNAVGMHRQAGANFDFCFRTSLVEKLLVPFTQYLSDALGSFLAGRVPINGAVLATSLRLLTEIPATFLSNGLINIAKNDRVDEEWTYLAHKLWKPIVDLAERLLKPSFSMLYKILGYAIGIFDPRIPNMYGVDIRTEETKAKENLPKEIQEKYKDANLVSDLFLFGKKVLQIPAELIRLRKEVNQHAADVEEHIERTIETRNKNIDLREATKKALKDAGIGVIRPRTAEPELNKKILAILKENQGDKKELEKKLLELFHQEEAQPKQIKARNKEEEVPKKILSEKNYTAAA